MLKNRCYCQKGRHPALDAGSPIPITCRRYRIKVRYDSIEDIILCCTPFLAVAATYFTQF